MRAVFLVSILSICLQASLSERFTVLSPDERNSRPGRVLYYRPAEEESAGRNGRVPWEEPLKHAAHLALHGVGGLQDAPYVGAGANAVAHRFGDVAVLARGRLLRTREGGFRFLEDDKNNDCEGCHIDALDIPAHNIHRRRGEDPQLAAVWTVRRVRHRDPVRGHRYELQFTITPTEQHIRKADLGDNTERSFIVRDDDYPGYFRAITNYNDLLQQYNKQLPGEAHEERRYRNIRHYADPAAEDSIRAHTHSSLNTNEYYAGELHKHHDKYPKDMKEIHPEEENREIGRRRVRFPSESERDPRYDQELPYKEPASKDPIVPPAYKNQIPYRSDQVQDTEIQQSRVRYGAVADLDSDPDLDLLRSIRKPNQATQHITHLHHHHYYLPKPDFQTLPIDAKLLHDEYLAHRGKYQQPNVVFPVFIPTAGSTANTPIVKFPLAHDPTTIPIIPTQGTAVPVHYTLTKAQKPTTTYNFGPEDSRGPVTFLPSDNVKSTKFSEPDPLYHKHITPPAVITTQVFAPTETSISEPVEENYYVTVLPEAHLGVNCTTHNLQYINPTQLLPTHYYEETHTEPMQPIHFEIPRETAESTRQYKTKPSEGRRESTKSKLAPTRDYEETSTEPMRADHVPKEAAESTRQYKTKPSEGRRESTKSKLTPTRDYEETSTEPMRAVHVPREAAESTRQHKTKVSEGRRESTKLQSSEEQMQFTTPTSFTTTRPKVTRGRVTRVKLSTTMKPVAPKGKWMPRRNRPKGKIHSNRVILPTTTASSVEESDVPTDIPKNTSDEIHNIISLYSTTETLVPSDSKNSGFTENSMEYISTTEDYRQNTDTASTLGTVIVPSTSQSNSTSISFEVGNKNKKSTNTTTEPNPTIITTVFVPESPKIYEVFKNEEINTTKMTPISSATKFRKQRTKFRNTTERPKNSEEVTFDDLTLSILNHARRESYLNKT